ncbi:hypothetical protein BWP39_22810 [Paraburkholderia acidicola]|uniref:Uncharacterized protein n=1 Tax=Paraburkholderia acidicola TaxID=1912599 RepID=A0A2A4EQ03_9BURK|nr:hypothetical protein BWP39_22810 [Paraburkholderia acidicola]
MTTSPILGMARSAQRVKVATRQDILDTGKSIHDMPDGDAKAARQGHFYQALKQSVSQIGSQATHRTPDEAYADAARAFSLPEESLPAAYKAQLLHSFVDRISVLSAPAQVPVFESLCHVIRDLEPRELQIEPLRALIEQITLPAIYGQAQQAIDRVAVIARNLPEDYHFDMAFRLTNAIGSTDNPDKEALCAHVRGAIPTDTMFAY